MGSSSHQTSQSYSLSCSRRKRWPRFGNICVLFMSQVMTRLPVICATASKALEQSRDWPGAWEITQRDMGETTTNHIKVKYIIL